MVIRQGSWRRNSLSSARKLFEAPMPVELPGLYWDEERNRYFPLSSKPKGGLKPTTNSGPDTVGFPTTGRHLKRKRKAFLWSTTQHSHTTFSTQTRYKNTQSVSDLKSIIYNIEI